MEQEQKWFDRISLGVLCVLLTLGAAQVIRYLLLADAVMTLTILVLETLIGLFAYAAWRSRMPYLLLPAAVGGFVLNSFLNYGETTHFALLIVVQAAVAAAWMIVGTLWMFRKKQKPGKCACAPLIAVLLIVCTVLAFWKINVDKDRQWDGHAKHAVWAVPAKYDSGEITEAGSIEELIYETKAYATDGRAVQKRALVYLPYGYDPQKPYNILYLMHGTGDDENYWLSTHSYNKVMLDRLIAFGEIEPLIVVTPTFYTEDDCKATGLDPLTFAFAEELRNDLMPAAESKYSTWASSVDDAGFAESREHRAFAGLSRGSVTTGNAALCGNLDRIAAFGMFSSFRTTEEHLRETIRTDEWKDLPILYLYASTGNFDFATPYMLPGYRMLTEIEPRLVTGVNTMLDVFPMRWHSIGHWHLALYNFLQMIF
jgi:enterochelin esterase-like enzyme